jgi:hypothetical protein
MKQVLIPFGSILDHKNTGYKFAMSFLRCDFCDVILKQTQLWLVFNPQNTSERWKIKIENSIVTVLTIVKSTVFSLGMAGVTFAFFSFSLLILGLKC